jgi:hypothetical protein
MITCYESNDGSLFLTNYEDGRYTVFDVTECAKDHTGIADMMAMELGDTEDWTVPRLDDLDTEHMFIVAQLLDTQLILYVYEMGSAAKAYFGVRV